MILATWNVNGLRSVSNKGFEHWFREKTPDVIALQEIKATNADVTALVEKWSDLYQIELYPALKKGYSGTALMFLKNSKHKPIKIGRGIGESQYDDEGRFIWAEYENCFFLTGYFPNGKPDHSRVDYKLDFSKKVFELGLELQKKTNKEVIIAGDINTAHCEIDLSNPKANLKTTGFLPVERAFLDVVIENGYTDIFRHFHQDLPEQYTWWTYRGDCRDRNIGWRLDYFFTTQKLLSKVKNVEIQSEVMGSDHCPVVLNVEV